MKDDRTSDLIITTALARTLVDIVERLDAEICTESTLDELRELARRAEDELDLAA
jgi:hypothetical protein